MKIKNGALTCAAILVASGSASAQVRNYNGSDTLEKFTKQLVINCADPASGAPAYPGLAAVPTEFNYVGGGSSLGGNQMRNGVQDLTPQSRQLSQGEFCDNAIPAGPNGEPLLSGFTAGSRAQNLAIARDGISVVTHELNARRCDDDPNNDNDFIEGTNDDFGATVAFSGTVAVPGVGNYNIVDWRDVLRIVYAGGNLGHAASIAPITAQPLFPAPVFGAVPADRVARCGSPLRRALVSNWDNIIQDVAGVNACGSTPFSCQDAAGVGLPLRHAYRRDDLSGTTDTFLDLLGLPAISLTSQPFCNGWGGSPLSPTPPTQSGPGGLIEDADPIRPVCGTNPPAPTGPILDDKEGTGANPKENATKLNDEICSWDRTAGLVQVISVPTRLGTSNTTATTVGNSVAPQLEDLYPAVNCLQGQFAIRRPPDEFNTAVPPACPDGAPYLFTGCLTPIAAETRTASVFTDPLLTTTSFDCNCVNNWTNRAPGTPDRNPTIGGIQNDGRNWNRYFRGPRLDRTWRNPGNVCPVLRDQTGVQVQLAELRLKDRLTTVTANPTTVPPVVPVAIPPGRTCQTFDATQQIGCLAKATECAIGFAGREAIIDEPNDDALVAAIPAGCDNPPSPGGLPDCLKDPGTLYNAATALRIGRALCDTDPSGPVRCAGGPNATCNGAPGAGERKGYGPERSAIFASVRGIIVPPAQGFACPGAGGAGYQFARKLYFNSIVGFNSVVQASVGPFTSPNADRAPTIIGAGNESSEIVSCLFEKPAAVALSLQQAGFLPLGPTPATAVPALDPSTIVCP